MLTSPLLGIVTVILSVLLTAGPATAQQVAPTGTDQLIYNDSLANGWGNVSRANVDLAAAAPVHAGSKSIRVSLDAWQLLNLRHDAFDASIYASLTFWIHGGPSGGRRVRVIAALNNVPQPPVTLAPLAANTWQRVALSLSSLGVASKPNMTGVWIQDATGTQQPVFYVDDIALSLGFQYQCAQGPLQRRNEPANVVRHVCPRRHAYACPGVHHRELRLGHAG